jgi:hypothetical protein
MRSDIERQKLPWCHRGVPALQLSPGIMEWWKNARLGMKGGWYPDFNFKLRVSESSQISSRQIQYSSIPIFQMSIFLVGPALRRDFTSHLMIIKVFNNPHKPARLAWALAMAGRGFRQGVLIVRWWRKSRGERRPAKKRPFRKGRDTWTLHESEAFICKALQGEVIVNYASPWITQQMEASGPPAGWKLMR